MDLIHEQARRNAESDAAWELYAPHRARVTQLLLDARPVTGERLCVLGAGNLNDIEVSSLLSAFREIVLVDVDDAAIRRGLLRQGFSKDGRVRIVAPVDVCGAFADLAALPKEASDDEVSRCLRAIAQHPDLGELTQCDVVASIGLLTQLIDGVLRSIGESHPRSWELVSAMRSRHLRVLLAQTKAGGSAVLVTEVVSSDSCPELLSVNDDELPGVLRRAIDARNFFTGTNPAALHQLLRSEAGIADRLDSVRFTEPWRWPFLVRTYAVYGVTLRTHGESAEARQAVAPS